MLNITNYQGTANQITVRYLLTPIRMASLKKHTNNRCWHKCGERGTLSYTVGENIRWATTVENSIEISQIAKTRTTI